MFFLINNKRSKISANSVNFKYCPTKNDNDYFTILLVAFGLLPPLPDGPSYKICVPSNFFMCSYWKPFWRSLEVVILRSGLVSAKSNFQAPIPSFLLDQTSHLLLIQNLGKEQRFLRTPIFPISYYVKNTKKTHND